MKPFFAALTLVVCLFAATLTAQAIQVLLDGERLDFDVEPVIMNDRTMVPMRRIFEAMGAYVEWDESTRTATATTANTVITAQIGNYVMTVNGRPVTLDVAPQIVGHRTLIQARAVAESLGALVNWIDETRTVTITSVGLRPARNPNEGRLLGFGNDGYAELQYLARFWFEQEFLPRWVFVNREHVLMMLLAGDSELLFSYIHVRWDELATSVVLMDLDMQGALLPHEPLERVQLAQSKHAAYGMNNHILNVTIERVTPTIAAAIIELRGTGWNMLSTFIGITFCQTTGLMHFFALEQTAQPNGEIVFNLTQVTETARTVKKPVENNRLAFTAAMTTIWQ